MPNQLRFRGQTDRANAAEVFVDDAGGERRLHPPAGARFDWGYMGESVSHLANAISAELFPADQRAAAANHIKIHFLIHIPRGREWVLSSGEIFDYVATRAALPRPAAVE